VIPPSEGINVEFKRELSRKQRRDVCKEVAAFASTEGGSVFIGIDDDGCVYGIIDEKPELQRDTISRFINTYISPIPIFNINIITFRGVDIIEIVVENGPHPIYYYDGKPYIRVGTISVPASPDQVIEKISGWCITKLIPEMSYSISQVKGGNVVSAAVYGQSELATMGYGKLIEKIKEDLGL